MDDAIIDFIGKYITLTEEEIRVIKSQNLIKHYAKNEVLLSEGEQASTCYFVLKGCVRAYYIIDGEERNTDFYTESQSITPVSYFNREPSAYFLSCLEDCVLALGDEERNKALIEQVPRLGELITKMSGELLMQKVVEFDQFKNDTPEQRYLKLMENRPDLMSRIPLYHLASYLGITQVSLSRIRKRLTQTASGKTH